ncbi:MAG: hypothetical protein EOR51_22070 [Mesorhizobium sp.]|nr:MAG: hypothetical protein EOR51_22070 [Mesorhizobium sp.]
MASQPHGWRRSSSHLRYPKVTDPTPLRPERHVANSIATIRIKLARALARRLPRCPCGQKLITQ